MSDATMLGEREAWYVSEVTRHLRRVPEEERSTLLAVLRDNLSERPPSASRGELLEALGAPADYAARLLREADMAPDAARGRRARSTGLWIGVGLGLVAVVLAGWFAWRWWTADPGIYNTCANVADEPAEVTVERREAAGRTEQLVSYADGAELAIGLCLSSHETVTIVDVELATAPLSLFEPTRIRARGPATSADAPGGFEPFQLERHDRGEGMQSVLIFGRLTDCEHYGAGSANVFSDATVTYDYRGRRRTTTVDLLSQYTFVSPPDAECPRPRDVRSP